MNKRLDDLTPEEVIIFNEELKNDFEYFVQAYPDIELGDTTDGALIKLRAMPRMLSSGKEDFSLADIFFDLQHRVFIQRKRNPSFVKLIVSDIQLLPKLENTTFLRGVAIKIKYRIREKSVAEKEMDACRYKQECECDCFMSCYYANKKD